LLVIARPPRKGWAGLTEPLHRGGIGLRFAVISPLHHRRGGRLSAAGGRAVSAGKLFITEFRGGVIIYVSRGAEYA
jgi:hypothetical protein